MNRVIWTLLTLLQQLQTDRMPGSLLYRTQELVLLHVKRTRRRH